MEPLLFGRWTKDEVVLVSMAIGAVCLLGVFVWQYWQAHRAYKRSLKAQTFWPPATETILPVSGAEVTRLRRRA